ncbi:MAG: NlpC/P60 family protein [Bacteroidales bacterium]
MKYGIALTPAIPMRATAEEEAEMTNQLLFGDTFRIIEEKPRWFLVENIFDGDRGWIDWKMATIVSPDFMDTISSLPVYVVNQPIGDIRRKGDKRPIRVAMGSVLPGYNMETGFFTIAENTFHIAPRFVRKVESSHIRALLRTAELYLNTSYLWGGRNLFGADCSGFVQVVYRMHGVDLPRNACQQIEHGEAITDFSQARPGDLAFFGKPDGHITHVGIVLTPDSILHCSGDVHVDKLSAEGIWSDRLSCLTHSAPILRRYPQLKRRR